MVVRHPDRPAHLTLVKKEAEVKKGKELLCSLSALSKSMYRSLFSDFHLHINGQNWPLQVLEAREVENIVYHLLYTLPSQIKNRVGKKLVYYFNF